MLALFWSANLDVSLSNLCLIRQFVSILCGERCIFSHVDWNNFVIFWTFSYGINLWFEKTSEKNYYLLCFDQNRYEIQKKCLFLIRFTFCIIWKKTRKNLGLFQSLMWKLNWIRAKSGDIEVNKHFFITSTAFFGFKKPISRTWSHSYCSSMALNVPQKWPINGRWVYDIFHMKHFHLLSMSL